MKTLQKTKQREDKRQDKKEARVSGQFAKCMSTYYERTLKEERDFVFSKLAQHDSWMPKLAAMFRSGALEKLLSMEAEQSKQLADEELERGGARLPCPSRTTRRTSTWTG